METKQDKDPYIWDYNIKVKTKDGYDKTYLLKSMFEKEGD